MREVAPSGKKPRVLVVDVETAYDNVRRMTLAVAKAFTDLGWQPTVIPAAGGVEGGLNIARQVTAGNDIRLVFSFYGVSDRLNIGGRPLFEDLGIRHHSYHLDHPFLNLYRILPVEAPRPHHSYSMAGESQAAFVRRHMGQPGAFALAHATGYDDVVPAAWSERTLEVSLIAAYEDPEARAEGWLEAVGGRHRLVEAMRALGEEAIRVPGFALDEACLALAREHLPSDNEAEVLHNAAALFLEIDKYFRYKLRRETALAMAPLGLHVFGRGWELLADHPDFKRATIHGGLAGARVHEPMRISKVSINPFPTFYESHDRPFDIMACGTACASYETPLYRDLFAEGPEILLTEQEPQAMVEAVSGLLAKGESLSAIAEAGRAACLAAHTWRRRLAGLLARLAARTEPIEIPR